MGRYAFRSLPSWQRAFWKDQAERMPEYCLLPDEYYTNKEELRKYCVMPNGRAIPHGPTDESWTSLPFAWEQSSGSQRYVIDYYISALVNAIESGDAAGSAMFAGVLGHYLQDSSQPGHVVHNQYLYDLVPRPAGQYRHLHRDLDDADPHEAALESVRPILLGTHPAEAAFHLSVRHQRMVRQAVGRLVPMIHAVYSGDRAERDRLITDCYATATMLTASAWYTAHCIAGGRFQDREVQHLRIVKLNQIIPSHGFTIDPYGFAPLMDHATDGRGNTIPLSLNVAGPDGIIARTFTDGIAMTWGNVQYDFPPKLYEDFRAKIGLLGSAENQSEVVFKVVLGGGPVVYEESAARILDYGGPIAYDSGCVCSADAARDVVVPLNAAGGITLISECPGPNGHALWVDPVLRKAD